MKTYACNKCGSTDVFLKSNGSQNGLYCLNGCGWLKWVSKKELPLVEEYIERNRNENQFPEITTENLGTPIFEKLKEYLYQKKWEYENIPKEKNSYNRGLITGIEISLKILEEK